MFVKAIEKVSQFTRPIHTIARNYNDDVVVPGAASLFFVNELGYAITCKHVATLIMQAEIIDRRYEEFKKERSLLSGKKYKGRLRELEGKYGLKNGVTAQMKNNFINCPDFSDFNIIAHPLFDLALIKFNNYKNLHYKDYAIFLKDSAKIKQGKTLCRLGYPFPEFSNFKFNKESDNIEWTSEGQAITPTFPIDGIITRHVLENGVIAGIELSTPGLKGQSGGPLFDEGGIIYGMQSSTHHLHLGFDIIEKEIFNGGKKRKVSNSPFLHVGRCIHVDIIKSFLKDNNVKFYEEDSVIN